MLRIDRAWKSVKPTSSASGSRGLMPVELLRPVVAAVASLARCVRACAEESNRIEGGSGWCVAAMDGDARVRSGYGARAGPGATTSATTSSSPSYMSIDGDDNGGAGGAKVWVLVLLFLLIVLMFLPSVVRRGRPWGGGGGEHHRGGGGLSLKSGRDVVNLCLVAFAILCGLLGRARRLAASPPSRLERTSSAPYTKGNSLYVHVLSPSRSKFPLIFFVISPSLYSNCCLIPISLPCNCEVAAIDTAGERDAGVEAGEEQLRDVVVGVGVVDQHVR
ncbi:Os12g0258600 [Oryza sativa Japonica Group]|uniref:Os12g0258600 protein n=1 Tax=Oryza sativa subsp. japonica TaxID=39947 RepID=A0A0P0Y8V9_ORYSJ|nr:Os12g0258600 [Oryza sativa Japonica Group]